MPECDFSLSSTTGPDENVLGGSSEREDEATGPEASVDSRNRRVNIDMMIR